MVERIVETAAREMGIDPAELRRRNFIAPGDFPYETPVALTYDTGDYEASLAKALEHADYAGFRARKAASEAAGKKRGIGLSCYIEACGLAPVAGGHLARCWRGPLRGRRGTGGRDRFRHRRHRLAQPRPEPRDHLRADHFRPARCAVRERDRAARRHGPLRLCPRHLRLAVAGGGRLGAHQGHRQDHCQGQEDRRPHAGGGRRPGGLRGRRLHGGGLEPVPHVPGSGVRGLRPGQLSVGGTRARPLREGVLRSAQLHLSRRGAHLRVGDRSGHRRRGHHQLRRRGRLRQRHQPDDRRRAGAWRAGAGHRSGAARTRRL